MAGRRNSCLPSLRAWGRGAACATATEPSGFLGRAGFCNGSCAGTWRDLGGVLAGSWQVLGGFLGGLGGFLAGSWRVLGGACAGFLGNAPRGRSFGGRSAVDGLLQRRRAMGVPAHELMRRGGTPACGGGW